MVGWCICVLMHDYRQLRVYVMAIELTSETYRLTKTFLPPERYGLDAQVATAARVGLVGGEPVRALREHVEKLKASITNLEEQTSPP